MSPSPRPPSDETNSAAPITFTESKSRSNTRVLDECGTNDSEFSCPTTKTQQNQKHSITESCHSASSGKEDAVAVAVAHNNGDSDTSIRQLQVEEQTQADNEGCATTPGRVCVVDADAPLDVVCAVYSGPTPASRFTATADDDATVKSPHSEHFFRSTPGDADVPTSASATNTILVPARQQQQQQQEDMPTPVISNRHLTSNPLQLPPAMELSPSPHSPERPNNKNAELYYPRSLTLRSETLGVSSLSSLPPRFSSATEEPIVMSVSAMQEWRKQHSNNTVMSTTRSHGTTPLSPDRMQRLLLQSPETPATCATSPAGVPMQQLSSSASMSTDATSLCVELFVRAGIRVLPLLYNGLRHSALQSRARARDQALQRSMHRSPHHHQRNKGFFLKQQPSKSSPPLVHGSAPMDTPISSSTTRPAAMVHGIPNYGQTCFLNSVLQALASLEPFMVYLSHMVEVNLERRSFLQMTELNADDLSFPSLGFVLNSNENITGSDTQQPLLCEILLDVLLSVNGQRRQSSKRNKNGATLDPRPVLQAVGKKHQQFQARYGAVTNSEQQDAQELLQAALGMVIEEGQFELTHTSALPSALASSFLSLKERDDDEEAATLVSGLFEMRLMKRGRRDALLHSLPPPPTTTTTTATTAKMIVYDDDMSKGSCAGLGERSYSPNSILPHKNELVPSTANGDMSSPSAGHGEEKKQEEFEVRIRPETSEEELLFGRCLQDRGVAISNRAVGPMSAEGKGLVCDLVLAPRVLGAMSLKEFGGPIEPVTKAMEIMMTTISSISPSPLSGWCGSVLMCASCRRVRPIQNVPCLDIPVAPTAVSDYRSHPSRSPGARLPPCRLEECLEEFTSIERVHDVECKNCTIQSEIAEQEREKEVQEQIIRGLLTRRMKRSDVSDADPNASVKFKHLRDELLAIEQRLDTLRRASPDDDEPLLAMAGNDGIDDDLAPVHIKLKRSDAFKCLLLTRLPSVLSIHVQRRYYDQATGRTSKTMQHVIFPNILDVAPYCAYGGALRPDAPFAGSTSGSCNAEPKAPISYKLMSVIEHQGGPYSGHYVSYRRDPTSIGRWLRISDDDVKVCEWATVRNCQAYMLFYEAM